MPVLMNMLVGNSRRKKKPLAPTNRQNLYMFEYFFLIVCLENKSVEIKESLTGKKFKTSDVEHPADNL